MSLTREIKDFALDIGYARVGITTADDFSDHIQEVQGRGTTYDFYVQDPRQFLHGARPRLTMPTARSIISLVWDYAQHSFPETLVGKVGRIYQSRCYNAPPDRINGARLHLMLDFLRKKGCTVGSGIILPERRAAARAGTARFGRNTFAHAKHIGSFILLVSIVVDAELEYDCPSLEVPCPKGCTRCMDACPTQAIQAPMQLNPRRCLAFNAWWTQEGRPCVTSTIPRELRAAMGTRVHGCDACQEACPRNAAKLKSVLPADPFLEQLAERFSLPGMLEMPDSFRTEVVQPIMYNYIKDKKYFQRNAAVALGNTGDPEHVPILGRAMEHPEEIVRSHAAWALGRIGGAQARALLETARRREEASQVQEELSSALETIRG